MAYYTPTGNPVTLSLGNSANIRSEFVLIQTAFNLLPSVIQLFSGSANYAVDSGVAANTYVISVNAAIVSLSVDGLSFKFKTANANTGASTLNTISIVRPDGSALQAGDIIAGMNSVTYNSTLAKFSLDSVGSVVYATNAAASAAAASASASAASASASLAASYSAALTSTSTTSLLIGTGARVFTTQANKGYVSGFFSAVSAANSANYMHGTIDSYVGTTLTTTVTDVGGSGTFADWNLSVSGSRGSIGATGAPGATVLLSTVTASASATVDVETTFDSTYDAYMLIGTTIIPATDSTDLQCRLKIGGSYQTATNYEYHTNGSNPAATTYAGFASSGAAFIKMCDSANNNAAGGVNFVMYIQNPTSTTIRKHVEWIGSSETGGGGTSVKTANGMGHWNAATTALTGVRFLMSSGNIASGTFRLYGIAKT